jgi:hypothetical protein
MKTVTKAQISDIFLYPLGNHFVFNGKMEFNFEIVLSALDRMGFQNVNELKTVQIRTVDTCKKMPTPPEIRNILDKYRQEKATEAEQKLQTEAEQKLQTEKLQCSNNSNPSDWSKVLQMLLNKYGRDVFKSWFSILQFQNIVGNEAVISTLGTWYREYTITHYASSILASWKKVNPNVAKIRITVHATADHQNYNQARKSAEIAEKRYG